jgi:16S rRNA U516 pseudouridylate synthase RsuA-like enzyme
MNQTHITEIINIFSSVDLAIETLHLQQIGRLSLGDLPEGDYLELTENEVKV